MVSILKTPDYDPAGMLSRVRTHFAALSLDQRFTPDTKVLIKPNLLMKRRPEDGTTTHPALIRAIILHLQELGVTQITVADSPGGVYSKQALSGIYKASGIEAVCMETGVTLNYDTTSAPMHNPSGKLCKTFELIRPVHEADCIISAGKLKTHCMTGLSGGVKNLFGCIPGLMKPEFHWRYPEEERFCDMLIDLCETVRPTITLIDAVVSMEGDGPSSGSLRETGYTFCAESPYELDLVLANVIHKKPDALCTVRHAVERGLSPRSIEDVSLVGDEMPVFSDFKQPRSRGVDFMAWVPKPLRGVVHPIVNKFLTPRPEIQQKKCIGCGKCAESCPAHTIAVIDGKARIARENCIKCYCCHEMCPVHAIRVKRSRLLDL